MASPEQLAKVEQVRELKEQYAGLIGTTHALFEMRSQARLEHMRDTALAALREEGLTLPPMIDPNVIFSPNHVRQLLAESYTSLVKQLARSAKSELPSSSLSDALSDFEIFSTITLTPVEARVESLLIQQRKVNREIMAAAASEDIAVPVQINQTLFLKEVLRHAIKSPPLQPESSEDPYDPFVRHEDVLWPALLAAVESPGACFRLLDHENCPPGEFFTAQEIGAPLAKLIHDKLAPFESDLDWEAETFRSFSLDEPMFIADLWLINPGEGEFVSFSVATELYKRAKREHKIGSLWPERVIGLRTVQALYCYPSDREQQLVNLEKSQRPSIREEVIAVEQELARRIQVENNLLKVFRDHDAERCKEIANRRDRYNEMRNIIRRNDQWISDRL